MEGRVLACRKGRAGGCRGGAERTGSTEGRALHVSALELDGALGFSPGASPRNGSLAPPPQASSPKVGGRGWSPIEAVLAHRAKLGQPILGQLPPSEAPILEPRAEPGRGKCACLQVGHLRCTGEVVERDVVGGHGGPDPVAAEVGG